MATKQLRRNLCPHIRLEATKSLHNSDNTSRRPKHMEVSSGLMIMVETLMRSIAVSLVTSNLMSTMGTAQTKVKPEGSNM